MIQKIKTFISTHKIISGIIFLVVVLGLYSIFKNKATAETRYVTEVIEKGSIVSSISGTGQVEASNTIDLKAKSSGTITSVTAKAGASVTQGKILFTIDAQDAQKAVRDAELNLHIAQNDLANARHDYNTTKASEELSLKNLLLTLNSDAVAIADEENTNTNIVTMSGSYNSPIQGRYTLEAYTCQGGLCVRYSGLESGTFSVDTNLPKALGTRGLYAVFTSIPKAQEKWYVDVPSPTTNSYLSNVRAYTEKKNSVQQAIDAAEQTVTARELAVTQRENTLTDAEATLSDYSVRAPFDGTIASVVGKVGDMATDMLATIITKQKLASITLNEVDVSKVSLEEKATLTFDAIDDLTITGHVAQIDGVGTVTQGVVSYTIKISLDTDDVRIKPGMSVSASIITATAQDVLVAPVGAVKTNADGSYVEIFTPPLPTQTTVASGQGSLSSVPPTKVPVTIGISDDTSIEIKSGVKEGDQIVARTITTTKTTTTTAPSLFGNPGARAGGNVIRGATR